MNVPDDEQVTTKEMVQLRKLQATMYAHQTKLFLRRLNKKPELKETSPGTYEIVSGTALDFDELREAILAFMHRPETVESFSRSVDFAEQNGTTRVKMGRGEIVIPLHPQLSISWVAAFTTYASVDSRVLYGQILKDLLAYQSYLIEMAGGDKDDKPRKRRGFAEAGGD